MNHISSNPFSMADVFNKNKYMLYTKHSTAVPYEMNKKLLYIQQLQRTRIIIVMQKLSYSNKNFTNQFIIPLATFAHGG